MKPLENQHLDAHFDTVFLVHLSASAEDLQVELLQVYGIGQTSHL